TASDSFQTHPDILDVTYEAMAALLERRVGFSFLTKGWIPERFMKLFSRYPHLIIARIGLVSLSERYRNLFEPGTAPPVKRLENIDRLLALGVHVEVRIDPVIPFYTDDHASIRQLLGALADRNIRTVSISYLHLRPAILEQLRRELPPTEFNVLRSCFHNQPWTTVGACTQSKLIPLPLRARGYARFKQHSKAFGITLLVCACKNPDMPAHKCSTAFEGKRNMKSNEAKQLSLFSC
ncbi:MAG: hypothetical protein JRJ04_14760, partial [Deltaproteobacteria bacterium]|nr:hypothetical protein [Deltaproteobacteria bacterium]